MDRSTTSLVMLAARALSMAVRRRGLPLMSPPPVRAETVISLMILVHTFDFLESEASFLCLIFDQRLCPDMDVSYHGPPGAGRVTGPPARPTTRPASSIPVPLRHHGAPQPGVAAAGWRVQLGS